jgi:hypothetical protein|tara:strand:- start:8046 stop:8999 length:954 start_codon:yes stop_codon:yes gene_type:complete
MAVLGTNNEQGAYPSIIFQKSQTWACPVAMEAIVYVIGAGGSGGAVGGHLDSTTNARGGAAGGCAVSRLTLAAQDYTVTIGSGGDDVNSGNSVAGDAGGNSELSGTGITTMTTNGGAAGGVSTSAQDVTTGGGTASGGSLMNNTGGGGGANTSAAAKVSAGGGVNLYGSNCHGEGEQSRYARGGTPVGWSYETNYNRDYLTTGVSGYKDAAVSISFFSNLILHGNGLDSTDKNKGHDLTLSNMFKGETTANQEVYAIAGPFCGGAGFKGNKSGGNVYAMAGGVGAGGGAGMNSNGTNYGFSGCGGSGLVMIFPIRMG